MLTPDIPIRRMTQPEETAYAIGQQDAESEIVPQPNAYCFNHEEKLAYERGYTNHAGEMVNG